VLLFELDLY